MTKYKNLEEKIQAAGNPVEMLRHSQIGPYAFPAVPAEFTNWRDEQRAWRETCAFFDQSHHMTDLYVEGPDAVRLLSDLGVNSFKGFAVDKGKQFVASNPQGYVIGDAILFYLEENRLSLVGRPSALNWVEYHAETGDYDATAERDERTAVNRGTRRVYRFQVQGPHAVKVMEKVTGEPAPPIRFFNMGAFRIDGCHVRALRHGMVGQPGWELFGPWADAGKVRDAIVGAGEEFGIRQVGSKAYPTSCLESGWIPSPLPAVYAGDDLKPYREWLGPDSYEAMASLGGSFYSDDITDYYLTPYDLGYGAFVRFDHDFVGRAALEKIAEAPPRRKVTLVWNSEDVGRALVSILGPGDAAKYIDLPLTNYATLPFDRVLHDGRTIGVSTYTGYTYNERALVSLATVDVAHSEPGTPVTVIWGEEGGPTSKPTVEPHVQTEIRATVAPAPLAEPARVGYRSK